MHAVHKIRAVLGADARRAGDDEVSKIERRGAQMPSSKRTAATGTGRDRASGLREVSTTTDPRLGLVELFMISGLLSSVLAPSWGISDGTWAEAWGDKTIGRALARNPNLDAVFCISDAIACGVIDGLRDRCRSGADEVAVVGFDNWEILAAAARPALTTVDM